MVSPGLLRFFCHRKIFDMEFFNPFRLDSLRRNGSYDELGVNCGGVVDDMFAVDVWLNADIFWPIDFVTSIAFLRLFTKRNSRSIIRARLLSICSNVSSLMGNSASICCFSNFRTCNWLDNYGLRSSLHWILVTYLMKRRCIGRSRNVRSQEYRMD